MVDTKYTNLIKDTFIFALGSFGSKIILFVLTPLYTNYLTTEEYGISNLVFTIAQFVIPLLSLEVFDAVVRFGLSKNNDRKNVLLVGFVIVGIDFILLLLLTPLFGLYSSISNWRWFLSLYSFLSILNNVEMNYLKVKDLNKSYALISILQTLTLAVLNILLIVVFHTGVAGYLMSNIIALGVSSALACFSGRIYQDLKDSIFDIKLFKSMLKYSTPLIFNSISWWLISSSDKIMVEALIDASALGIYEVATKIPGLINVFILIFQQSWGLSTIKEIESTNDSSFYSNTFRFYKLLIFGAAILILSVIKPFMRIYVGESFYSATSFVPYLLVSAVYSAISTFYGSLYTALKKSVEIFLTTIFAGVINVVFNYIMIQKIGIMGAVFGTVLAYFLIAHVRMIYLNKYISIHIGMLNYLSNNALLIIFATIVTYGNNNLLYTIIIFVAFMMINRNDLSFAIKSMKKLLSKK